MKNCTLALLCLALLPFGASCSGEVDAGKEGAGTTKSLGGLEKLDLGKLGADEMKQKATELASMLGTKLQEIKDEASAIDVRKAVEPALTQLASLKTALGDKLPSMSQLATIVDGLKAKFQGNEAVMKVLQPILDQVQKLIG